jgi:hypothetical protein
MVDYERGLQQGERVIAPPIALPPRKIENASDSKSIKSES